MVTTDKTAFHIEWYTVHSHIFGKGILTGNIKLNDFPPNKVKYKGKITEPKSYISRWIFYVKIESVVAYIRKIKTT